MNVTDGAYVELLWPPYALLMFHSMGTQDLASKGGLRKRVVMAQDLGVQSSVVEESGCR